MSMKVVGLGLLSATCLLLAACGTVVPNLEEPWKDRKDAPLFVHELSRSIHCEVRNAILSILEDDRIGAAANHLSNGVEH